jgi:ribosomal protein S18 acetylase RimI-like enzyme
MQGANDVALGLSRSDELADANLIEAMRELARWQFPCEWEEQAGVLLVAGANESPRAFRNCVARVDPRVPAEAVLAQARAFFGERGRGFTVFVRLARDADLEHLVKLQGMELRADSPCMWIDRPLDAGVAPAGIELEAFTHPRHVADSVAINAEAYQVLGVPDEEMRVYFAHPERLLSQRVSGVVAYRDGRPLSTALTIHSGEGAGLYFVGTAKHAERQGLAELCTRRATNLGFERGAKIVTLQASPGGEPIYTRLGYRFYDRLRWYR